MEQRPTIVTLVGSSRFKDAHIEVMRDETLAGRIVIPLGLYGHADGEIDMNGPVKEMLDKLHLQKILASDEILVVNVARGYCKRCQQWLGTSMQTGCGCVPRANYAFCNENYELRPYIGDSTRREIQFALEHGKKVRYLIDPEHREPA